MKRFIFLTLACLLVGACTQSNLDEFIAHDNSKSPVRITGCPNGGGVCPVKFTFIFGEGAKDSVERKKKKATP